MQSVAARRTVSQLAATGAHAPHRRELVLGVFERILPLDRTHADVAPPCVGMPHDVMHVTDHIASTNLGRRN